MTSQQRADEWLRIWRELRRLGYSAVARDRIIEVVVAEHHQARIRAALENILDTPLEPCFKRSR